MKTVKTSPDPIVVPAIYAAGAKPGRFLRFVGMGGGMSFPVEIYGDK